ncbi:acetyltransferase [Cupriavidus malaysiensis]|uniref:Acetyltransferase n=1 Tax=Cupriavidus malaysiensis TaxID=367825 RepID=A0ABM6F1X4_9BURK|nr:acetyltransferase [Cupriavidus malaysiensis]AOZ05350.1 acetyltransferase [Cupriavidus malaysiensis]
MRKLALLGASGHGKVVADSALAAGYSSIEFFDDAWPDRVRNGHWAISGDTEILLDALSDFDGVIVTIGDCSIRLAKTAAIRKAGGRLLTVIHPHACVSKFASLGDGSVVMAGAIVNADVTAGTATIINSGATVDHDCLLDDGVHISPGAHLAGNVIVGRCSWIGIGAAVKQGVTIGADVVVGAGAVVVSNISDHVIAVGCPASPLQFSKSGSCGDLSPSLKRESKC